MSNHTILRLKLALVMLCLGIVSAFAVVPVHINSGNPTYPFPQFLPYTYGSSHSLENLGTKNPEGVVHIEMEQDIRDAYQIFANEWEYTGETVGGVKYIRGNIGCPYDCREGDGYALLAAAVMGDKISFDGLWMRLHDKFRIKQPSYETGVVFRPDYEYGNNVIMDNGDAATDGDVDISLALYIAWKQWGDDSGIKVAGGKNFSYFDEMVQVIFGLVEMNTRFPNDGEPRRHCSGEVGIDGYLKSGNTWTEITDWASTNLQTFNGVVVRPEYPGPQKVHADYLAAGYFDEYYRLFEMLKRPEVSEFELNQFKRCAASSDWIVGNWCAQKPTNIFMGEHARVSADNVVTLEAGNQGGRFRSCWRTALNYTWHGAPDYTWNPTTHQVESGSNDYELLASKQLAGYMNSPQKWGGTDCVKYGGGPKVTFQGPATLNWDVQPSGIDSAVSTFTLNWVPGCGMASAINAEDLDLAGLLYRQCNIEWDASDFGDGYLSSIPVYFHGFFRWLGMIVGTGNHHAPSAIKAAANMKIYRSIEDSVTFAYTGDKIKYLLDYRNFGSLDAKNVKIVENVPVDFIVDEASISDGGKYNKAKHTITWDLGTVAGLKSDDVSGSALDLKKGNLAKTIGQVSYECTIGPNASGRYCTTAEISCSNGTGWTSNEYPNYITPTMQRNCVDVIMRALTIEKTANVEKVNPGNLVEYKIDFENSSKAGWLDGGRPRVTVAMCNNGGAGEAADKKFNFRLYSDAIEPYINYGNYRIAYYLYDAAISGIAPMGQKGWGWRTENYEGRRTSSDEVTVTHEPIVEGSDELGKWNQRICIQFSPCLVTTTAHVSNYMQPGRVHKGGTFPLRLMGTLFSADYTNTDFSDDWSWDPKAVDAEAGNYFPVSPSWQSIDPATGKSIEVPITEYLPSVCDKPTYLVKNILVEEYDGYVWRRILGTGPMAGREAKDVVVIDTLPKGMEFVEFVNTCPLEDFGAKWSAKKGSDGRWIVKWEIPTMQVKQKGSIIYTAKASFPSGADCPTPDELTQNVAWILADKNSPISDTAEVTVTCAKVPKPIIPTTLVKSVDKENVEVGDDVEYTLEYEQTHGAIFKNAGANASDWSQKNATISGGTVSLSSGSATYKYSLSTNIYVEMDVTLANGEVGEFIFRDDIRLNVMNPHYGAMEVECYEGSTKKGDKIKATLVSNPSRWKFKLTDDVLQVWIGKDTTTIPIITVEGLKVKEGRFGVKCSNGMFKFSDIYVHTDNAYNLVIVDKKPEEITFVSAEDGGKLEGDSIVWRIEPSGLDKPIKFGEKFTVTWTGKVESCNELVINEAYVKLYGHSDDEIRAMVTSECGATEECEGVQKATLTIDNKKICEGDETVIRVETEPKGKYNYVFYWDNDSITSGKYDTLVVSKPGDYKVKVSDPACAEAAPVSSNAVELVVSPIPDKEVAKDVALCGDEMLDLSQFTAAGYTIRWFTDEDTMFAVSDLEIKAEDANNAYYYVLTDEKTSCVGEPKSFNVVVNEIPSKPIAKEGEYPKTVGASASIQELVKPVKGNTLVWYEDETSTSALSAAPEIPLDEEGEFYYYVSQRTQEKCESERVKVVARVTHSTKPSKSDTAVCIGETVDLASLVKTEEGNTLVWYDESGAETSEVPTVPTDAAGVFTYKVSQTDGTSVSDPAEISVEVIEVSKVKGTNVTYCENENAVPLEYDVENGGSFTNVKWTEDGNPYKGKTAPVPNTTGISGSAIYTYGLTSYYEISSDHVCEGESIDILVTVMRVNAPSRGNYVYSFSDTLPDGKFESLVEHSPNTIKAKDGYTLVWYDEKGNIIGDGSVAPTPVLDRDADLQTLTYYVSQKQDNGKGCESEKVEVTVTISKTLPPNLSVPPAYCEDSEPDELVTDFASPTDPDFTLVWYDEDKNPLATPPTEINTSLKDTANVEEVITYYVAQEKDGAISSAVPLKIHIYAKPRLKTKNDTVCNTPVNMKTLWAASKTISTVTSRFYKEGIQALIPETVTETGNYEVEGYFVLPGSSDRCFSKRERLYVEIHKLNSLSIDGSSTVCPDAAVTLTANYDGETYGSAISYKWNMDNNSSVEGEFISNPLRAKTPVMLIASDGFCSDTVYKVVDIDKGEVSGSVTLAEDDNEQSPKTLLAGSNIEFFSCGGEVTITPNVVSTDSDFEWSNGQIGKVLTTAEPGTYTVSYTNKCKTYFDVKITSVEIKDNTVGADIPLCENGNATLTLDLQSDDVESIVWSKDGDVLSGNDSKYAIEKAKVEDAGLYTYIVKNKGCVKKGTYGRITVSPEPVYTLKPVTKLCAGNSLEIGLESLEPVTAKVEWTENDNLVPAGNTAVVTPDATDTYTLRIVQEGGCLKEEKIKVNVSRPISFEVSPTDTTVCEGTSAVRLGVKVTDGDVLSYKWFDSDKNVVSTNSLYRASANEPGEYPYTVVLESEACDSVVETVNLKVSSNPIIDTVIQKGYKDAEVVVLEGTGTGVFEYKVDKEEYQTENIIKVKTYGKHTFTVRDDAGCVGVKDANFEAPELSIPVVVTPNGDGVNDAFISEVLSEAYPDATVTIYDRRGKVVAKIPASEGWDGTYNGHRMPSTDYWYEIWVEELRKTYVGHFTLIND